MAPPRDGASRGRGSARGRRGGGGRGPARPVREGAPAKPTAKRVRDLKRLLAKVR